MDNKFFYEHDVKPITALQIHPDPKVFSDGWAVTIRLPRKDQRFWLKKVFCLKQYEVTEALFPRKKKRGTMRRRRRMRKWKI